MPKLFTAIDLSPATAIDLTALQPPASPGLRRVATDQMHVTLHFLGDTDIQRIAEALSTVAAAPFQLDLQGVGCFRSKDGSVTLWAGVQPSAELLHLHTAVAAALAGEGFQRESRPYTPHVSLARWEAGAANAASGALDELLTRHARFRLSGVPVTRFGLYSSSLLGDVPVYRCEQFFPLPQPYA